MKFIYVLLCGAFMFCLLALDAQNSKEELLRQTRELQMEVENLEEDKKGIVQLSVTALIVLTLVFAFVLWNRQVIGRKQKILIEKEKRRAEESEKYKEQFLANMSHEIRTPMHAISGMVKVLKRNEHLKSQAPFLEAMEKSAEDLLVILNDILDLSKIEAGKIEMEQIPVNPLNVVVHVVNLLKIKAEEKGLQLNYHVGEKFPESVVGDPTRLTQILTNLIGNGLKFTENGSVTVTLESDDNLMTFKVKDTGIGIRPEKLEHIFRSFTQEDESTTRLYGGTGLGLSVTKQLVELQGGDIWVESEVGKGSIFGFTMPIIKVEEESDSASLLTEEELKSMASEMKGLRILLVEDNDFNVMVAQDDLNWFIPEVNIDIAKNGEIALEKFYPGAYDLILMDVHMPEMNGFQATRQIRQIEEVEDVSAKIPIIAMTASLLKKEIDLCMQAGMNHYIPKPYKIDQLIGTLYSIFISRIK